MQISSKKDIPSDSQPYKVCVRCFTYNQQRFIKDAMEGFAMQQTTFPFVATIVDDASTDNTPSVIIDFLHKHFAIDNTSISTKEEKDYGTVYFVQHKTNQNCYFAVTLLKENHYSQKKPKWPYISKWENESKYQAICEGDDYWTDPLKLQKQADILDNNTNVTMVYTNYGTVDDNNNSIFLPRHENVLKKRSVSGDILPNLFISNFPLTLTTMIRKSVYDTELYKNAPIRIDYSIFFAAAFMGDCIYLKEETGCYRSTETSITHSQRRRIDKILTTIYHYYAIAYASGKSKKEGWKNDHKIKLNICKNLVNKYERFSSKEVLKKLIYIRKSFILQTFIAYFLLYKTKVNNRLKRIVGL